MRRHLTPALLPAALLLTLTACSSGATDDTGSGGAAGACLEGSVGCDDTPLATGTGGAESGADGSVPVVQVVTTPIDGFFLVSGYYVAAGDGARLCESLAESSPPQCGGASLPLELGGVDLTAETTTEGDVSWSVAPVSLEGQVVDGVFVVGSP